MATLNNNSNANRGNQPTKNSTPRNNENTPHFVRDNTQKHRYEDHQEITNDEHYDLNNPEGTDENFDLRDKSNNLEDTEENS
ncbi:MAG: hypothetical protein IR153_11480 [Flavobacterium sp.]|nr:hypothetical protein [Flavobacterium sp.]